MSDMDALLELRRLLAEATQGEWFQEPDTMAGRVWVAIGSKWWPKADIEPLFQVRNEDAYEQRAKDAALIVAAVNALPALLERVEAAEGDNEQLRVSVNRDFGEPLDEVYKTDGITIVMQQIHDLRRERDALAAKVANLADAYQAKHDRVCKDTEDSIPMSKRHAHDCGVTAQDVAVDLRAALTQGTESG